MSNYTTAYKRYLASGQKPDMYTAYGIRAADRKRYAGYTTAYKEYLSYGGKKPGYKAFGEQVWGRRNRAPPRYMPGKRSREGDGSREGKWRKTGHGPSNVVQGGRTKSYLEWEAAGKPMGSYAKFGPHRAYWRKNSSDPAAAFK